MMKFFNTAGPVNLADHYVVDPLHRMDLDELLMLIQQKKYFILHAPRQTGKTSMMLALRDYLNKEGSYYALYTNVEIGQASRNDYKSALQGIVSRIAEAADSALNDSRPLAIFDDLMKRESFPSMLSDFLQRWCKVLDKPLVLFVDEIDSLIGDTLVSVLRQLRDGYANRPQSFPSSVILCGVRDIRDYRIQTSGKEIITGGSAFNIKAKSLRLGNFTKEDIEELYMQHTRETGQKFEPECFPVIWDATEGQPWLVNALGYEVTMEIKANRNREVVITPEMIIQAKENIIYRRDTHIDILIDKLREDRVRRVIAPILANNEIDDSRMPEDDILYVRDLGLITLDKPIRIANSIYREIIPRELTWSTQQVLLNQSAWYILPDGRIDMNKLMVEFQQFFRMNADSWIEKFDYKESGPQLLLQAFLQRIVNGGGFIDREYGLGRGRTDLLITKPIKGSIFEPGGITEKQRIVLELKIKRGNQDTLIEKGLQQTADYMDKTGTTEGHFILFNRDKDMAWDDKIWHETRQFGKYKIEVWGM